MKIIINKGKRFECEFKSWKDVALRFLKTHKMSYEVVKGFEDETPSKRGSKEKKR